MYYSVWQLGQQLWMIRGRYNVTFTYKPRQTDLFALMYLHLCPGRTWPWHLCVFASQTVASWWRSIHYSFKTLMKDKVSNIYQTIFLSRIIFETYIESLKLMIVWILCIDVKYVIQSAFNCVILKCKFERKQHMVTKIVNNIW